MLKFGFVNDAAAREYKDLPEEIQNEFGKDLRKIQFGQGPNLPIRHLSGIPVSAIELKINGSPAYRCVYVTKYLDAVIVLHSFVKTTNGVDRPAMEVVKKRAKHLKEMAAKQHSHGR